MHYLIILLLVLSCTAVRAQRNSQPVPGTIWGLEVNGGLNLAVSHQPIFRAISLESRTLQPGWRAGLAVVMDGARSASSLLVGVDVLHDRVALNGYREENLSALNFFAPSPTNEVLRFREGTYTVAETQLRGRVVHRIRVKPITLSYGLAVSGRVGGGQRFDFTQTTLAWIDPASGRLLNFTVPLMSEGQHNVPASVLNEQTYGALLFGVGYRPTAALLINLEAEVGVHVRDRDRLRSRYRRQHLRVGLTAAYRLIGEKKK